MSTSRSLDPLFRPFPWAGRALRNRIVMAPMTRSHSPGKVPGPDVAAYYRRRAEGGTALIITEGTNPDHPAASGYPDVPGFYGEQGLAGWQHVVDEVHAAGGAIIPQLWHCGSIRTTGMEPDPGVPGFAPSAIRHPVGADDGEVPHEMTQGDIDDTIASFVRQAVGAAFPIVFRFSQWKQGDYEYKLARDPGELERFLLPLARAGVDVFHASTRRFDDAEFEGSPLNLAGWAKKIVAFSRDHMTKFE